MKVIPTQTATSFTKAIIFTFTFSKMYFHTDKFVNYCIERKF